MHRPFYSEYAWAYDLIIDRPVASECSEIGAWLAQRQVLPGARILDAGCGVGLYAIELARMGYRVDGIDASAELISEAQRRVHAHTNDCHIAFSVCTIQDLPNGTYDAVLCRGVLNDFVNENDRRKAFKKLSAVLREGGALVFDVREWTRSMQRKRRDPKFTRTASTQRGELTFNSITKLDTNRQQLLLTEQHRLQVNGHEKVSKFEFKMHCWTQTELDSYLEQYDFSDPMYFGAYDSKVHPEMTDRLVVVAKKQRAAA